MKWLYACPAWVWVALVLTPFFGVPACGFVCYFLVAPNVQPTPFDSTEWKAISLPTWTGVGERVRGFMARDLLDKQDLRGKTREEMHALLGPPDGWFLARPTRPFIDSYQLNPQFGADDFWLIVRFDTSDRVVSAAVEGD